MEVAVGERQWRERASDASSIASQVASVISGTAVVHFKLLSLTKDLWALDRKLKTFLDGIYEYAESGKHSDIPPTDDQVRAAIENLRQLSAKLEDIYQKAKAKGLTNRALVGPSLDSVRMRADDILDLAESAEIAMNPAVDESFEQALEDLKSGKVFDLADFK